MPAEMTCSSGYIADASSARTPGQFLQKPMSTTNGRNFVGLARQEKEDEDEDEEPTGFFGIMSEFKKVQVYQQMKNQWTSLLLQSNVKRKTK